MPIDISWYSKPWLNEEFARWFRYWGADHGSCSLFPCLCTGMIEMTVIVLENPLYGRNYRPIYHQHLTVRNKEHTRNALNKSNNLCKNVTFLFTYDILSRPQTVVQYTLMEADPMEVFLHILWTIITPNIKQRLRQRDHLSLTMYLMEQMRVFIGRAAAGSGRPFSSIAPSPVPFDVRTGRRYQRWNHTTMAALALNALLSIMKGAWHFLFHL